MVKNYSSTLVELEALNSTGEIGGYNGKFSFWIASKEYLKYDDPKLNHLANSYLRSKFIALPSIIIGVVGSAIIVSSR